MKHWLWLPAAALLALSACDDKDGKSSSSQGSAQPAFEQPSDSQVAHETREAQTLTRQAAQLNGAANGPSDEVTDAGRKIFDGAALRNAGFADPGNGGGVYAGNGGSNGSRYQTVAYTYPKSRGPKDLSA